MTTVLIVCDIRLYREGLEQILCDHHQIRVVGTASSREEAIDFVRLYDPKIVLLDMAIGDSHSAVWQIVEAAPGTKVIALAIPEIESEVVPCAEAGIAGYVKREGSLDDLLRCIEAVAKGEFPCSPRIAGSLVRQVKALADARPPAGDFSRLTRREIRVLELVEQGLSNKDIARKLIIEVATVKNHVHNIFKKLQVHSRGEAAALLRRSQAFPA